MLGKLMKHEWKSVSKVGSIILLATLVVTLIGCIFLSSPVVANLFAEEATGNEFNMQVFSATMLIVASFGMYVLLLVGAMYGILIYMGVHFYKTMYTDQGYLVHTLPVTPHQILLSKTVISGIWMLLVNLALVVSIIALVVSFVWSVARGTQQGMDLGDVWRNLNSVLAADPDVKEFAIVYVVVMIASLSISPFFSVMMMFCGLTIGQLSKKYKVMMSILSCIGLWMVYSIVGSVISMVATVSSTMQSVGSDVIPVDAMISTYGTILAIMIIGGVILYFTSHYIISKKLNMD